MFIYFFLSLHAVAHFGFVCSFIIFRYFLSSSQKQLYYNPVHVNKTFRVYANNECTEQAAQYSLAISLDTAIIYRFTTGPHFRKSLFKHVNFSRQVGPDSLISAEINGGSFLNCTPMFWLCRHSNITCVLLQINVYYGNV